MPSSLPKVRYHAEYHSKINSISLSAQVPPTGLSCRIGPDAIDLIPSTCPDDEQPQTESLSLPARVMPTRTTLDQSSTQSSFLALKLTALPNMTTADASSLKSVTFSEFPASPLPASQLQGLENLACGCCGSVLLLHNGTAGTERTATETRQKETHEYHHGPIRRVVDLPSEHWQELVDCWMCHEEDFTELREGDLGARLGQALVGGTYLLIHAGDVDRRAVAIEEDARSIDVSKTSSDIIVCPTPPTAGDSKPRTIRRPVSRATEHCLSILQSNINLLRRVTEVHPFSAILPGHNDYNCSIMSYTHSYIPSHLVHLFSIVSS